MSLHQWELDWLGWARPIVRMQTCSGEHFAWCRATLGPAEYPTVPEDPASDPTLRYPGYVGEDWRPGHGVLFVGSVHADFRKDGRRRGDPERVGVVADMVAANVQWRDLTADSLLEDAAYLKGTRDAYSKLIPGWTRDEAFSIVREELVDTVKQIGWTNLAHCRAQPGKTPGSEGEYPLQRACSGAAGVFPLSDLLDSIRPAAVLVAVSPIETDWKHARSFDLTFSDGTRPLVWAFSGRDGKRHGEDPEVWAPKFAEFVAAVRSTR